jgi:hypothetical protein
MNCGLSPDTELFDQPFVTGKVAGMQIVQQPTALAYQLEQAATRMMIFRVRAQMLGELLDARRQQRDLYLRRSAVVGSASVGLDYFPFAGDRKGHQELLLFPYLPLLAAQTSRGSSTSKGSRMALLVQQKCQLLTVQRKCPPGWVAVGNLAPPI